MTKASGAQLWLETQKEAVHIPKFWPMIHCTNYNVSCCTFVNICVVYNCAVLFTTDVLCTQLCIYEELYVHCDAAIVGMYTKTT